MKFDNRKQIEEYTISKNIKNEGLFYLSKPHRDRYKRFIIKI